MTLIINAALLEEGLRILPQHMRRTAEAWVLHGVPGGHFFDALVAGDLREAWWRADPDNRLALLDWIKFFVQYCPKGAGLSADAPATWPTKLATAEIRDGRDAANDGGVANA